MRILPGRKRNKSYSQRLLPLSRFPCGDLNGVHTNLLELRDGTSYINPKPSINTGAWGRYLCDAFREKGVNGDFELWSGGEGEFAKSVFACVCQRFLSSVTG